MPMLDPYDQMMQARLTPVAPVAPVAPTMPAMGSGAPEDFLTRARMLREQAVAGAPQGIDPRIAAILARREERLAGQEEEIGAQESRSPWDALARAGAAMASSQSPFFGQGAAAGVSEGLNALNQGRAEAVRRRIALGGARDDIEMERIEQEGAGRKQAVADLETDLKLGTNMAELSKAQAAAKLDLARAREIDDPVMRRLKIGEAQRRLAKIDSEIALDGARIGTERAQAFKYAREGAAAGTGGGKGGSGAGGDLTPTQRGNAAMKLKSLNAIEKQLDEVERLAKAGVAFSGGIVGAVPGLGYISGSAGAFDKAAGQLKLLMRPLTRTPGEGSMDRYETKMAEFPVPSRADTPDALDESIKNYRTLIQQTRDGYREMLGLTPRRAAAAPPAGAVDALRKNPALAAQFDQKYGAGASAAALGVRK